MATAAPSGLLAVCANPGVLLVDDDGTASAFASLWLVDWSVAGAGDVLFVCRPGQWRMLTDRPDLGWWLASTFVRHFGEARRFDLPAEPTLERVRVDADLDLERGVAATAGDVAVEISDVLDRRPFAEDRLTLGGAAYGLRNVYVPCATGGILVAGAPVPGRPEVSAGGADGPEPTSSTFLAVAETWTLAAGAQ